MTASIVEVIQHYQRSIDSSQDNEDRLLYCIKKLYKLPIKVEHLQETGVGKTVNSLRKFNGEIGVAAKSLVTKWKAMVAAGEEPMDTTPHDYDKETHHNNHNHDDDDAMQSPQNSGSGGEGVMDYDDNENHHTQNIAQEQHKDSGRSEKERNKERKERSSKHSSSSTKDTDNKHKSSSSSSSRNKEGHEHKSSSSGSKEREKEKTEHKSRDKPKDKHQDKDRERSEKRKEEKHKPEKESTSHKSSSSKSKSNDKPSSSSKDKSDQDKERSDKHKGASKDRESSKEDKTSPSSSKDKHDRKSSSSSSSQKSSAKDTSEPTGRKRRSTSDTESNEFKPPQPKIAKISKPSSSSAKIVESSPPQENDTEGSFDSSMGANFGDILGMLNMPAKKAKKSPKSATNGSSVKDSPKPSTSNSINSKVNGIKNSPPAYHPQTSTKVPTAKPDLLASTTKLEPLDPSIALELPTISTNYKPMPLNLTVMDCVFNTTSSNTSKQARTLSDAEALQHGISSKTMRTKIYSGAKTGQTFQVSSLFDMCIRVLQKNIDALEYTGGVPFEVLRPILERATPQQLYAFEDFNPYIMEDSDVLWKTYVSRNYRTQKRLENESWREMFMRCQEEEERRLSFLKNSIKQSQKIAAAPVRKTQLAFIDSMVKPPRNVLRKQEQYGTKSKLVATPASRVASLQSVTPNAAKTGDQRLKVSPAVRDHAQVASSAVRPKKAPLMQKALALIRGRLKR